MLIDWFTVGAQALNFIILVWMLKRYLYRPILDAVDAREKRIADELADADRTRAEAQAERDTFQHKNAEIDRQRAALLTRATEEAAAQRQRLLDEARQAADALAVKRREALQTDAASLNRTIRLRAQREVFAIARKALADLATASLEHAMADVFVRRLQAIDGQPKADFAKALEAATGSAIVRSAFDLPEPQRASIGHTLIAVFGDDRPVRFETAPDLVGGIELLAGGQKIAWTIDDYLAVLEQRVADLVPPADQAKQP